MKTLLILLLCSIACFTYAQKSRMVFNGPDPKTHLDSSQIVIYSQANYLMDDGTKRHSWTATNFRGEILDSGNDFDWNREQKIGLVNDERRNTGHYHVLLFVCGYSIDVLIPPYDPLDNDVDIMVRHYFGLSYWD